MLCGRFVAVLVCGRFWMYAGGCVVGAHEWRDGAACRRHIGDTVRRGERSMTSAIGCSRPRTTEVQAQTLAGLPRRLQRRVIRAAWPILVNWIRPSRYDCSRSGISVTSNSSRRRSRRSRWSTVSKAADIRSRPIRTVTCLSSATVKLRPGPSVGLLRSLCVLYCMQTGTGWSWQSWAGGVVYRRANARVSRDRLASLAMAGANTWAYDFSKEHGRTSSGDDLDGMPDNSFRTSSEVTGSNEDSCGPRCWRTANVRRTDDCSAAEMLSRMRVTLSTKKWHDVRVTHCRRRRERPCVCCATVSVPFARLNSFFIRWGGIRRGNFPNRMVFLSQTRGFSRRS